ncbi:MAG: tRNA (N6-isopentenyl adenosine(37)-C2)-methylthiotransferase MiaB [Parcubacteria group bacterium]|jgi:tRNA-2-methylthio-N6-dimethylallyladenosine synthase
MMTYFIKVFGCQMNQSDAERISAYLEKLGIKKSKADLPAEALAKAGLIVFVTCGVRQSAEDRVYGQINNIKKKYPEKKIVLTGCLAHRKDVQRRLRGKVDLFCEIKSFPEKAKEMLDAKNGSSKDYLSISPKYSNLYTAYIPIMTGCNNFCTYCVVPYARGREYSRPAEDVLKEVKSLTKKGCKEIVLLGQNVNSYKSDSISFPKLLRMAGKVPGQFWISFLTSHPKDMSDELIKTIANSKKICEYISLPAQSGDDEILRKMNRQYTAEHYKNLLKKIRSAYKKNKTAIYPAISTDIIVGFPGETKKQFENSAKLLGEMKFDMAYVSQYSPRPETAAWRLKDNISGKEKERREKVLTEILSETSLANNKKYVRKMVEVLVDKKIAASPQKYQGHTRTQKKVMFCSSKKDLAGKFVKIKITIAKTFGLEGKIL